MYSNLIPTTLQQAYLVPRASVVSSDRILRYTISPLIYIFLSLSLFLSFSLSTLSSVLTVRKKREERTEKVREAG